MVGKKLWKWSQNGGNYHKMVGMNTKWWKWSQNAGNEHKMVEMITKW